jgi:predicted NUDIX family NTP pyrophosphohydrolase
MSQSGDPWAGREWKKQRLETVLNVSFTEVSRRFGSAQIREIERAAGNGVGMTKVSAGVLLYRRREGRLEVLLVHPGGPFWMKKDRGVWSIPKGELEPGEDLLSRARQELHEETSFSPEGPFMPLVPVKQPGKLVRAWAAEGEGDATAIVSNTFQLEYTSCSGRIRTFPEVDRAGWFDLATAREKIITGQRDLLDQLERMLDRRFSA